MDCSLFTLSLLPAAETTGEVVPSNSCSVLMSMYSPKWSDGFGMLSSSLPALVRGVPHIPMRSIHLFSVVVVVEGVSPCLSCSLSSSWHSSNKYLMLSFIGVPLVVRHSAGVLLALIISTILWLSCYFIVINLMRSLVHSFLGHGMKLLPLLMMLCSVSCAFPLVSVLMRWHCCCWAARGPPVSPCLHTWYAVIIVNFLSPFPPSIMKLQHPSHLGSSPDLQIHESHWCIAHDPVPPGRYSFPLCSLCKPATHL